MANRSKTRFSRGVKPDVRWATPVLIVDQAVINASNLNADLINDTDWDSLLTFERVTLLAIKGWLSYAPGASTPAGGLIWSIWKQDTALTTPSPLTPTNYDTVDTLLTGGVQFPVASTSNGSTWVQQIDVKVKRRMTTADKIVWAARSTTASANYRVSGFLRCLWQYTQKR